jgi:hypothetical protein
MENLYAIKAYDMEYGGDNGIVNFQVIEAVDDEEAGEIADEMSREIIADYDIPDEAPWIWQDDAELDELIERDVAYKIYKLNVETANSLEELSEEFENNPDAFLKKYEGKWIY